MFIFLTIEVENILKGVNTDVWEEGVKTIFFCIYFWFVHSLGYVNIAAFQHRHTTYLCTYTWFSHIQYFYQWRIQGPSTPRLKKKERERKKDKNQR